MKTILFFFLLIQANSILSQNSEDSIPKIIQDDSLKQIELGEVVISASRIPEQLFLSPISIDVLNSNEGRKFGSPSVFDALENTKGVQILTPSLGFKVINTRGFANTTNVRFTQLIDGIDNQAPHLGAPIANALGANDLDIDKIEIIPGTASALYGMNALNGLINIRTKNPFLYQGLQFQQLTGVNHLGNVDNSSPQLYSVSNLRYAKVLNKKWAFKINFSYTNGQDWQADNRTDLGSKLNESTGLSGYDNPAYDEVNGYGNESSNRKTITLGGKKYVVSRTGYREVEIADYSIQNMKGDIGFYYRPKAGSELSISYKGALINTIYQRSNRFRLEDYTLHQYVLDYHNTFLEFKTYLTQENTGKSYNLRSLAENMDRAFKSDNQWFSDYTSAYTVALTNGSSIADAHKTARTSADEGRYEPGTDAYEQKKQELININNWDQGAALRVRSFLSHSEGLFHWDKVFQSFFKTLELECFSGFDHRTYVIVPDGNYFINPVDSSSNLLYSKTGAFTQITKDLFSKKLRLGGTIRFDKTAYFNLKINPRITAVFSPKKTMSFRLAYQSGYRFPSIFEGFSNVNSGGVKRVGGLPIMSNGIFENSYTKASIDAFQAQVTTDINSLGLTQSAAIEKNKSLLKKNPYTYLKPEFVRSFEFGFRGLLLNKKMFLDMDFYYNSYDNFIAQVEASVPKTSNSDSIATFLYSKSTQDRYRLWTNSKSKIYTFGSSLGINYHITEKYSFLTNFSYSKLQRTADQDGLEDGYNTPNWIINATVLGENIWKNLGASITAKYQSKFNYVSFLVSGEVPEYWTMDAQLNYSFKKQGITAKFGATNLLNKSYFSLLGGPTIGGMYYVSLTLSVQ